MPSPFPGMNPFIESDAIWQDFHQRFIYASAAFIAPQARPKYFVKVETSSYIHEQSAEERKYRRPDVAVSLPPGSQQIKGPGSAVQAPAYAVIPFVDMEELSFVEVIDRGSRKLVTAIEVLSPSNKKHGGDRDQYLAKRQHYFSASVNLVEIDLLRGFDRLPVEGLPPCDYFALVSRAEDQPRAGVWPIKLRDALPTIPIPLRHPDPDVTLDLQAVLNRVYDEAFYGDVIYDNQPEPPLSAEDDAWARSVIGK